MSDRDKLLQYDEEAFSVRVDDKGFGPRARAMHEHLTSRVIGQDRAASRVARGFSIFHAGLSDPTHPIGAFIFAGPTGVGKTMLSEELGRHLIADVPDAPIVRIQCGKYKESHRVSELIGSPPGYVKSDEPGRLAQLKIDEHHFWLKFRPFLDKRFKNAKPDQMNEVAAKFYEQNHPYFSVILFDEVEKAHPDLWNLLLHIIDDGQLQMANGDITSFRHSVIILTCNVGGKRQQELLSGNSQDIGFSSSTLQSDPEKLDAVIYEETVKLIERNFPPELVGRLRNELIVFRTLTREQSHRILDNMLAIEQKKLSGETSNSIPMVLLFAEEFKEFLLDKGIDPVYGVRPLKKTVRKFVTLPIANAIECNELRVGDEVLLTVEDGETVIRRKPRPEPPRRKPAAIALPEPKSASNGQSDDET